MRLGTAIEKLVENYNYAVGKEWVQDKVAWALYHTWKEADDRKTENCSEIPNNCDTCRNKGFEGCEQPCLGCGCCGLYEPKDEPKSYTTWANTEPKQGTDCTQVDWKDRMWAEAVKASEQTEPSTDCGWK